MLEFGTEERLGFKIFFCVRRAVKDDGRKVIINPTVMLGACEIDKTEKLLLPLHSSKKGHPGSNPGGHNFVD